MYLRQFRRRSRLVGMLFLRLPRGPILVLAPIAAVMFLFFVQRQHVSDYPKMLRQSQIAATVASIVPSTAIVSSFAASAVAATFAVATVHQGRRTVAAASRRFCAAAACDD